MHINVLYGYVGMVPPVFRGTAKKSQNHIRAYHRRVGSLHFGATMHNITFRLSVSAADASEVNLSEFFLFLLENAMKNAPMGVFATFSSRNL